MRAPDNDDAPRRQQLVNQIRLFPHSGPHFPKRDQLEAILPIEWGQVERLGMTRNANMWMSPPLSRRACLVGLAAAMAAWSATARAQASKTPFEQWVAAFRARARARGISDANYTRVMRTIKPGTAVFEINR